MEALLPTSEMRKEEVRCSLHLYPTVAETRAQLDKMVVDVSAAKHELLKELGAALLVDTKRIRQRHFKARRHGVVPPA